MALLKKLFGSKEEKVVEMVPSGKRFSVPSGKTILEAALEANIEFPHGCTVGTCGSCKCKMLEGKVGELRDFAFTLTKEELDEGYILACQGIPKKDLLRLEVDEEGLELDTCHVEGTVKDRSLLTDDICEVEMAFDGPVEFAAGQFARVRVPDIERERCYSFAEAPLQGGQERVTFFIKKVSGGAFTERLFAGEFDGVSLSVSAPEGYFYLRNSDAPMLCVAGGSGLAPLLSIFEDAVAKGVQRDCIFLFGARTRDDLYCQDRIEAVQHAWNGTFRYVPVISDDPLQGNDTGQLLQGMVTDHIESVIAESGVSGADFEAYMAGPPPMIDAAQEVLRRCGTIGKNIHFDRFVDESYVAAADSARSEEFKEVAVEGES